MVYALEAAVDVRAAAYVLQQLVEVPDRLASLAGFSSIRMKIGELLKVRYLMDRLAAWVMCLPEEAPPAELAARSFKLVCVQLGPGLSACSW